MRLIDKDEILKRKADVYDKNGHLLFAVPTGEIWAAKTVDAIPIAPLAVWLAGYHVSPPEYALKETGALDPIDQASTVFSPNQIATAWDYHLRKLMESGLMS